MRRHPYLNSRDPMKWAAGLFLMAQNAIEDRDIKIWAGKLVVTLFCYEEEDQIDKNILIVLRDLLRPLNILDDAAAIIGAWLSETPLKVTYCEGTPYAWTASYYGVNSSHGGIEIAPLEKALAWLS